MKIYLYLMDKIVSFTLPKEVNGSYSFDADEEEEIKLINIEARDNEWVLYSTNDVRILDNNIEIASSPLQDGTFHMLKRNEKTYLISVLDLSKNKFSAYQYKDDINLIIGNNAANIAYLCPMLNGFLINIHFENDKLVLDKNKDGGLYINNNYILARKVPLNIGDKINIYGLNIIILNDIFLINNPINRVSINQTHANISKYEFRDYIEPQNVTIKDVNLYNKNDYFSKSPRIRRIIETKVIKLSPPPKPEGNTELPMILTIGPMLTMAITSGVTLINTVSKIAQKETTVLQSWPSLLTSIAMITSMLLWPNLTRKYNKNQKIKKRQEVVEKYTKYLSQKRQELEVEKRTQREILIENLISVTECVNIIKNKGMNFWDKRIDQSDFLVTRIGVGNELLDVKVEYPEEGFSIEEDELKEKADNMVENFKYIENVPISYSFYDNIITAIMGSYNKSVAFTSNIILQLITFYSYEDLKIVLLTKENNKSNWDYIKYLNHNFTNDRSFRLFSSNSETAKNLAEYLNIEVSNRLANKGNNNFEKKPHYLIITDDYNSIKRFDFIKTLTEEDENLGFSIIILEERLSKLPSKCNNFISIGASNSGVLKNSYEKQEQIVFQDEINTDINMMEIAKIVSNIPIEFEKEITKLPDAISFMEMERVGKVEQLNILNRWNTNDTTTSLKAEVGVDEQEDLIYLDLHEKYHGPHGLIAGTTGSGKSEFIITYILSMCINYSPDDVSFILIDYKGGGLALAFENKTNGVILPHLAGTITNLDKAEMDRTLVSIDSEIKRRQARFNEAREIVGESTMDIYKYQKHFHEGRLKEPISHLFIICDEFAELKSQQPEFMDNLISVARIGRSLGVHLILATQKPSGVVNDQIWSNTRFRVCLKVQDESDSNEMLKRPEAASLKQVGRFYLQVGYNELFLLGQSGWCGDKYYPSEKIVKKVDKSINFMNESAMFIKSIQASKGITIEPQGEQLTNIMNNIIETANTMGKRARRLWLDSIPEKILINALERKYNVKASPYNIEAIIGEYDAPERQEQGLVSYKFLTDGNTLIYGNDGIEKENLLSTIIYSTVKSHTPEELNYYIIDYGSETLRRYQSLPQVGGMVFSGENEKYSNLLKMLKEELKNRKKIFINYGGEYINYIKNSQTKMPLKVIILNNYDSIYESNQSIYEELPELVRDSERYGIIFIITANAINSVSSKISSNFKNMYSFKLKDSSDYNALFGTKGKVVPREIEGRGLLNNDGLHEFQTASILENEDDLNDYLIEFINHQKQMTPKRAKRIPVLPNIVGVDEVKELISNLKNIPIGIEKKELEILKYDYLMNLGNIITSNKLANTTNFVKSLISIFRTIPNTNLIVIDPLKLLELNTTEFPNYYYNNLTEVIDKLIEYISNLIETKSTNEGVILIYGLNKFTAKLNDNSKLENFVKKIKEYEKISIIAVDDVAKLKSLTYESWFINIFSTTDGIWIGRGISDQSLLKLSSITKEMTTELKNDMGYMIQEGLAQQCKFIDFITKDIDGDE